MAVCRSHALLVRGNAPSVLLLPGEKGWKLPAWDEPDPKWWNDVRAVNEAAAQVLGVDVTTLRCIRNDKVGDDVVARFYELEGREPDREPAAGEWIDAEALRRIHLADEAHRPLVESSLLELSEPGGPLRVPWARQGWFGEASAWIRERLGDVEAIVQERTWSISAVMRVESAGRTWYFKAVPSFFASEPALTLELSRRHPGRVPTVAAVDTARGWLLMEGFHGPALEDDEDLSTLADALRMYARMQIEWVERPGDLLALGCPDRPLEALEPEIDRALADTDMLLPGRPNGLSESEVDAVPALRERLRAACEQLRGYALPATLEHGDLHTGNVVATEDGLLIYDWSDGCLSVPFFSLVPLFEFGELSELPHDREVLRAAYLEPWRDLGDAGRLEEAFELSLFVGLFHQAISYSRIIQGTEPRARWEWERAFPWLVRKLLEHDAAR